tara:strand:+ start:183 stop:557 length:375 start_codon:yes stop_codon:yes gene_type:complete
MINATYAVIPEDDLSELYMEAVEVESEDDDVTTDELYFERQFDNHIKINGGSGTFYIDGLNGLMNHVIQECDGTIHFTFEAQPDNNEGDHFGRGWIKTLNEPSACLFIHDDGVLKLNLEKLDDD